MGTGDSSECVETDQGIFHIRERLLMEASMRTTLRPSLLTKTMLCLFLKIKVTRTFSAMIFGGMNVSTKTMALFQHCLPNVCFNCAKQRVRFLWFGIGGRLLYRAFLKYKKLLRFDCDVDYVHNSVHCPELSQAVVD